MTEWLRGDSDRPRHARRLQYLLERGGATAAAGVYDGLSAVLAKEAGFEVLYLSGAALSASMALPDLGLLTLEDVWRAARTVIRAADRPLIVDCDTGFGEALNIMRAVREMESVGVACIQIEDQQFPKKCGHLNDKRLIPAADMCRKVAAARKAATEIMICARTDAAAESLADAIDRANRYAAAGADLIFVEGLSDHDAMRRVRDGVRAPLLANMTEFGRTPQTALAEWQTMGYQIVIFPASALRVSAAHLKSFYGYLHAHGQVGAFLPQMMTRVELYDTIEYYDYEALDSSIAKTVLE